MRKPPKARIQRWIWRDSGEESIGVMISSTNGKRVLIPRDQLAIFADFAIDTLEETE